MWDTLFQTFRGRLLSIHRPCRLSVVNVLSDSQPQITESLAFVELIHSIRELELSICTGLSDSDNETSSFFRYLPQALLGSASQNLRILHISADTHWGWRPVFDLRGIYFPRMEDFTLDYFAFSHDWQLYWFLDIAESLRRLRLIRCEIIDPYSSEKQYSDSEGCFIGTKLDAVTKARIASGHKKRWSHYFKTIEESLPKLQLFSLKSPEYDHCFKNPNSEDFHRQVNVDLMTTYQFPTMRSLSSSSYSFFGSYFAIDPNAKKNLISGEEWKQQHEEDKQALLELVSVIARRNGART